MTKIAITGHRGLPPDTARLVDQAIRAELSALDLDGPLIGITCLADGADQLFARAVVDLGGTLEVVIPAEKYREGLPPESWAEFDSLATKASEIHRLPHVESDSNAHMDASEHMLSRADQVFAVWDGQPARGYGGTADVVAAAVQRGLPVVTVWPEGATRD